MTTDTRGYHCNGLIGVKESFGTFPYGRQMTSPALPAVVVERLSQAQIHSVYPLMREVAPALSLARWLKYARPVATSQAQRRSGVLVAHRCGVAPPVGAVCYRRDRDMLFGSTLTAEHFIAVELLSPEPVLRALLTELDHVAAELHCAAIRSIVHGARPGLLDDLRLSGHVAEGVTLTKKLPVVPPESIVI